MNHALAVSMKRGVCREVRLRDICETINGLWKGVKPPFVKVGVVRSTNFTKKCKLDLSDERTVYLEVEEKKYQKRKLRLGDVIVERSGGSPGQPVGRAVVFDREGGEFSISNFTSILRFTEGEIDSWYIYYYLLFRYYRGDTNRIQSNTIGLHNLDFDMYCNFRVLLPPKDVQREVVCELDKATARLDAIERQFEKLRETAAACFKSVLKATFDSIAWDVRLSDQCEVITDGDHLPPPKTSSGIPFLVISDVADGRLSFENTRFVPKEYFDKIQASRKPRSGDVILTVTGSYGIPVEVDVDREFCFQRHIALVRSTKFLPRFLVYMFLSPLSKRYFERVATGAAQKTVSLSNLRSMNVCCPSVAEQRRLVARLDAAKARCDGIAALAARGLANCARMRKAILAEAFAV